MAHGLTLKRLDLKYNTFCDDGAAEAAWPLAAGKRQKVSTEGDVYAVWLRGDGGAAGGGAGGGNAASGAGGGNATVKGPGALFIDFGVERAAWLECLETKRQGLPVVSFRGCLGPICVGCQRRGSAWATATRRSRRWPSKVYNDETVRREREAREACDVRDATPQN